MNVSLLIRFATSDDAEQISKMIHELALYEQAPEDCHATAEAVTAHLFCKSPRVECLIAELNGEPAGFAMFFHNFSTWNCAPGLYLEDLFVRPAYRRQGIASRLMESLATIAVDRGCKRFEWSVLDWNKPARDFYHGLGARGMDEWVIYRLDGEKLLELAQKGEKVRVKKAKKAAKKKEAEATEGKQTEIAIESEKKTSANDGWVVVHTDGGAEPNPGIGGWAAVMRYGDHVKEISGGDVETTNNRMELTAAISALEALKKPSRVVMVTDSQYVRNGITLWIKNWKRNGWRKGKGRDGSPVLNDDLWKRLDAACERHDIKWEWVKGHAGNEDNERADEICSREIKKQQR